MLFNSLIFLVFFSLFLPLYWAVQRHLVARNLLILAGSYVFYAAWDWRFLSLIMLSTGVDFVCGRRMYESDNPRVRKTFLIVSLVVNIGLLATFKYFGFFVESFSDLLTLLGVYHDPWTLKIILPVGISFYTFQTLSYTIDIYRKKLQPTHSLLNFAAFVSFFPQLVAGPIERARSLLPQIEQVTQFRLKDMRDGAVLVLWGLFKKVIIADRLAVYVDSVFASPDSFGPAAIFVAVFFFSIQIYCDFSGYSDVARGLAKMLGINITINFRTPYFSTSLAEFWRRWHISLSTWFRDYVFIPLGGSRSGSFKTRRNIFATFVLSGIWHGANYTFIIWGFLHALGYLLDPFPGNKDGSQGRFRRTRLILGWLSTMFFVHLAWIFFRAGDLSTALFMIQTLLTPGAWLVESGFLVEISAGMRLMELVLTLLLISFLLVVDWFLGRDALEDALEKWPRIIRWSFTWILLAGFLMLGPAETGSFIYFQF